MAETHLLIETHWQSHFAQRMALNPAMPLTVRMLREWIDQPRPMGLPVELQNLVILTFAAQTNRRFAHNGGPYEPDIDRLLDEVELREQTLPGAADWGVAVTRAATLFGLVSAQSLNAANVGKLVADVKRCTGEKRNAVAGLVAAVADRSARYAAGEAGARRRTAESAQALLAALSGADETSLVITLATALLETSEAAVGRAMAQAQAATDALAQTNWQLFDAVGALADHRQVAGQQLTSRLAEVLRNDEHVIPLKTKLDELVRDAVNLLTVAAPATPAAPQATPPVPPAMLPLAPLAVTYGISRVLVEESEKADMDAQSAATLLDHIRTRLENDQDLELTLHWRLQRKGTQS
jgi:hypothetical protein